MFISAHLMIRYQVQHNQYDDICRTDVHLQEGDTVHVIGEFDSSGRCYVTDKQNLLVVQPDTLVSGTSIVSSLYCMRR